VYVYVYVYVYVHVYEYLCIKWEREAAVG